MSISKSKLHYTILQQIIKRGYAPEVDELSKILNTPVPILETMLQDLQEYHGVVLHPNQPKVWVIHPFSLAPTNFYVTSEKGSWWGNCAWCSLGIAALIKNDVTITTTLGGEHRQVSINIKNGLVQESGYYIHFPIAMRHAWDNVIYTCSTMLLFERHEDVDKWCRLHGIPKGDVQPIEKIWSFSKQWYGNHLNPDWKKWTVQEAKDIFAAHGLDHDIWQIENSEERF